VLLAARDLEVRYGRIGAVRGVGLEVGRGEIVAVLGANGAGKSSLLRALLGLVRHAGGRIELDGADIGQWPASRRVAAGLALVPEGRRIITTLTVHENLLMGAYSRRHTTTLAREIDAV
jgi:branched-chain amino acid transport system ATP-binding protein